MRNVLIGAAGLSVLGFGLACSGMEIPGMGGGASAFDNVGACKRYVEADNCPETLNRTPCDLATYYDCMAGAVKCNGEIPDLSGTQACGAPTCN
jgi:hypothetical protein